MPETDGQVADEYVDELDPHCYHYAIVKDLPEDCVVYEDTNVVAVSDRLDEAGRERAIADAFVRYVKPAVMSLRSS